MGHLRFSDEWAILGTIDPDAYTANTYNTDVIDLSLWGRVAFVVACGDITSTGTADLTIYGDTASNGSFATAITGKSLAAATFSDTASADKQAIIEVDAAEVADQGLRYVRGSLVIANAAIDAAVIVLGGSPRYLPASDSDLASVAEIIA